MLFNSVHFLFFLPIVFGLYYLLPQKFRWILIFISSCYFYMVFVPKYILILFLIIVIDYVAALAIVKAWKGDTAGNLIYKSTASNFNPLMAMAGRITIAEVEELVPSGALDQDQIHTPGIYVHRIFQGAKYEKRIEQRTVRKK